MICTLIHHGFFQSFQWWELECYILIGVKGSHRTCWNSLCKYQRHWTAVIWVERTKWRYWYIFRDFYAQISSKTIAKYTTKFGTNLSIFMPRRDQIHYRKFIANRLCFFFIEYKIFTKFNLFWQKSVNILYSMKKTWSVSNIYFPSDSTIDRYFPRIIVKTNYYNVTGPTDVSIAQAQIWC